MKTKLTAIGAVVLFLLIPVLVVYGAKGMGIKTDSELLNTDLSRAEKVWSVDTHGGFHGDGISCTAYKYSDGEFLSEIKQNPYWRELPMTESLNKIITGGLFRDRGENILPEVANGYYFFLDRQSEGDEAHDDSELWKRYSKNFTLAIYDTDTDTLYFAEYDS